MANSGAVRERKAVTSDLGRMGNRVVETPAFSP
jgi:hypothetical protein